MLIVPANTKSDDDISTQVMSRQEVLTAQAAKQVGLSQLKDRLTLSLPQYYIGEYDQLLCVKIQDVGDPCATQAKEKVQKLLQQWGCTNYKLYMGTYRSQQACAAVVITVPGTAADCALRRGNQVAWLSKQGGMTNELFDKRPYTGLH